METSINRRARIEAAAARLVMFVMAAAIAYVGSTLLVTPLAIPLTIVLWLGAASIVGLGVFGRLPNA
jgi:hypothetical protein